MCLCCVCHIYFEHFRCILECCHMFDFVPGIILVCAFSCPSDVTFYLYFLLRGHMWQWYWCIRFYYFKSRVWPFSIFGVTVKSWFLVGWGKIEFFWVHWLDFIWLWLYIRHTQRFCIGDWIWLQCTFYLGSFLVHFLEFLLAYLPDWHPWRYCWGVCFSEYFWLDIQCLLVSIT